MMMMIDDDLLFLFSRFLEQSFYLRKKNQFYSDCIASVYPTPSNKKQKSPSKQESSVSRCFLPFIIAEKYTELRYE